MTAVLSARERIKAARGAKRTTRDVDVVLDQAVQTKVEGVDLEIDELEREIADHEHEKEKIAPELRFSDPRPKEFDELIAAARKQIEVLEQQRDELRAGTLMRLRFERMDPEAWADITARHPARVDSSIDQLSGYNYHATAKAAAPLCGYALGDDDTREDLEAEDWAGLFEVMSGRELEWLASALWDLNDFGPRRRIDAARKASAGDSGSKSS